MTLGFGMDGRTSGGTPTRKLSATSHGCLLPEVNIALVGPPGVGKSALTVKYLTKRFITEYDPDLEDVYCRIDSLDNQDVVVNVMDTCDKEFKKPERYLKWADALAVVYNITCRKSFETARKYLEIIEQFRSLDEGDFILYLVGNKVDLERYREISSHEGSLYATRHDAMFVETAATEDYEDVTKFFHDAIRSIIRDQEVRRQLKTVLIADERGSLPRICSGNRNVIPRVIPRIPADPKTKRHEERSSTLERNQKFKIFNKGFKLFQ